MYHTINPTADYFSLVKRKKQTLISIVVAILVISLVITVLQPFKYSSNAKVLVIQNYGNEAMDPYAASKASEFMGAVLSRVMQSESFYNEVLASDFKINQSYFPTDSQKRAELWNKTLSTEVIKDSGVMTIAVYHPDKYQADQIMRATLNVITTKHQMYHGMGSKISIKVIDQPFNSKWPVKPNVPVVIAMALIFGTLMGLVYIYLFPESRFDLSLWPGSKRKRKKAEANYLESNLTQNELEKVIREKFTEVNANHANSQAAHSQENPHGNIHNLIR